MGDVGVDLLRPQYVKTMLVSADTAYWEALYQDGTVLSEAAGGKYMLIDRTALRSFKIVHNGESVIEIFPPPGATGHNLVYRRRTSLGASGAGRGVVIIMGWAPMGPIFVVDLDAGQYHEDALGILPTLTPMPGEPDDITVL